MYIKCQIGNKAGYVQLEDLYKKTVRVVDTKGNKGKADINDIYVGTVLNCYYQGLEAIYDVWNKEIMILDDRHWPHGENIMVNENNFSQITFIGGIQDEEVVKDHFDVIKNIIVKEWLSHKAFNQN